MLGAPAEGARNLLECSPGSYSSRSLLEWDMPDEFDAEDDAQCLPADPNIRTDCRLISDKVSGASSAGSGFYVHLSGRAWRHRRWRHHDDIGSACPSPGCAEGGVLGEEEG